MKNKVLDNSYISERSHAYKNPQTKRMCTYRVMPLKTFLIVLLSMNGHRCKEKSAPVIDAILSKLIV